MTPNKCKCNWYPYINRITDLMWGNTLGYYVLCESCGKRGMIMATPEDAVKEWNNMEENAK